MKSRDRYLTGILLILVGILIGTLLTLYQQGTLVNDTARVNMTEVKRSTQPFFSDEDLQKIDDRFLFKNIARMVTPTVVYIETIVPISGNDFSGREPEEDDGGFWDQIFPRKAKTVGSGVIISTDGYILTNNHVINDALRNGIRVVLNDKRAFRARIVGTDPSTDLAVIKIDARQLPAIVVGNSDNVEVGEWVLAIGNPFRLRSTVTAGIVSALGRSVDIINEQLRVESFIQTDAAINKGNSGGALVNTSGELIGINTAIASQNGSYQGYGFAVPINLAIKVASDIIEYGEVRRAVLGVSIGEVNSDRARDLGMDSIRGVEIRRVDPGGAADKFNLKANDVILAVNGEEVNEMNQLQEKIALLRPDDLVKLKVWRNGKTFDRNITLGDVESMSNNFFASPFQNEPEMDLDEGIRVESFDLGFGVAAVPSENNNRDYELVVTEVYRETEAWNKGMKRGQKIEKINDLIVEDLQTLKDLVSRSLETRGKVTLQVEAEDGSTAIYELKRE